MITLNLWLNYAAKPYITLYVTHYITLVNLNLKVAKFAQFRHFLHFTYEAFFRLIPVKYLTLWMFLRPHL